MRCGAVCISASSVGPLFRRRRHVETNKPLPEAEVYPLEPKVTWHDNVGYPAHRQPHHDGRQSTRITVERSLTSPSTSSLPTSHPHSYSFLCYPDSPRGEQQVDLLDAGHASSSSSTSAAAAAAMSSFRRHIPYLSFHKQVIREICRPQKDDLLIMAKGLGMRRVRVVLKVPGDSSCHFLSPWRCGASQPV